MKFDTELVRGRLIKRYKRFLADIELDSGETITAHCPNTGRMLACSTPGSPVALSVSDNPKRKYPHTLEMVYENSTWIGVNTSRTNEIIAEAIREGAIQEFQNVEEIKKEVKTSDHTRLDLQLVKEGKNTFIEIKNCSLAENNCAMFPDAVTERGTKHLHELIQLTQAGEQACIFFLLQRMDADIFKPATHIDAKYSETLALASKKDVMILAYQAEVTPESINVVRRLPYRFE